MGHVSIDVDRQAYESDQPATRACITAARSQKLAPTRVMRINGDYGYVHT